MKLLLFGKFNCADAMAVCSTIAPTEGIFSIINLLLIMEKEVMIIRDIIFDFQHFGFKIKPSLILTKYILKYHMKGMSLFIPKFDY